MEDKQTGGIEALRRPPDGLTDRVPVAPGDVILEPGYWLEPVAVGLTFPASVTFDDRGNIYVGERGFPTDRPSRTGWDAYSVSASG